MVASEPFMALVVYPTTPEEQSRHADNLMRLAADKVRQLPGFVRARVFLSEDGYSLVTLSEWADRDSFQQFRSSDFGRAATLIASALDPKAYWLRQHAVIDPP